MLALFNQLLDKSNFLPLLCWLTNLSVKDFLFPVAERLDDLQDWVKQSEVTESPRLIIKLLPLRLLGHAHKDVTWLLLVNHKADIISTVTVDKNLVRRRGQRSSSDLPAAGGTVGTFWPR